MENLYVVVVVVCLPTKQLGVLENSSKHVHAFQIESTPILSFHEKLTILFSHLRCLKTMAT